MKMWHVERVTQNLNRSRCSCLAALNAHAAGKQRYLRLKPVFSMKKQNGSDVSPEECRSILKVCSFTQINY